MTVSARRRRRLDLGVSMTGERTPWGSMPWEQDAGGNALPHPNIERNKPRFWFDGLPREAFPWELAPEPDREPKPAPTGWACPAHGDADVVTLRSRRGRVYGSCTAGPRRNPCGEFER